AATAVRDVPRSIPIHRMPSSPASADASFLRVSCSFMFAPSSFFSVALVMVGSRDAGSRLSADGGSILCGDHLAQLDVELEDLVQQGFLLGVVGVPGLQGFPGVKQGHEALVAGGGGPGAGQQELGLLELVAQAVQAAVELLDARFLLAPGAG